MQQGYSGLCGHPGTQRVTAIAGCGPAVSSACVEQCALSMTASVPSSHYLSKKGRIFSKENDKIICVIQGTCRSRLGRQSEFNIVVARSSVLSRIIVAG